MSHLIQWALSWAPQWVAQNIVGTGYEGCSLFLALFSALAGGSEQNIMWVFLVCKHWVCISPRTCDHDPHILAGGHFLGHWHEDSSYMECLVGSGTLWRHPSFLTSDTIMCPSSRSPLLSCTIPNWPLWGPLMKRMGSLECAAVGCRGRTWRIGRLCRELGSLSHSRVTSIRFPHSDVGVSLAKTPSVSRLTH